MDIKEILNELNMCTQQDGLTVEQRYKKITIFSAALRKANKDQLYAKYQERVKKQGQELEKLTNGEFKLDSNIILTEMRLRHYIANSGVSSFMVNNNMSNCTFNYLQQHAIKHPNDLNLKIVKAIQLYQSIEKLGNIEHDSIITLAIDLSELLGYELMSDTNNKVVIGDQGIAKINSEEKNLDQFYKEKDEALSMISSMRKDIGEIGYEYAYTMVDQVFNYYIDGNKELELDNEIELKNRR